MRPPVRRTWPSRCSAFFRDVRRARRLLLHMRVVSMLLLLNSPSPRTRFPRRSRSCSCSAVFVRPEFADLIQTFRNGDKDFNKTFLEDITTWCVNHSNPGWTEIGGGGGSQQNPASARPGTIKRDPKTHPPLVALSEHKSPYMSGLANLLMIPSSSRSRTNTGGVGSVGDLQWRKCYMHLQMSYRL